MKQDPQSMNKAQVHELSQLTEWQIWRAEEADGIRDT